ncbi:MAG: 2-oxoacid:acceptor oxidoreductase family protein [Porphyromonas sp.]|nr:2-oxoacid:acceptor oxidoreductase family protein [Porphyromonas sp.]
MKTYEIVISGFGGQGVLSMGKILAYSGLMGDKEVSWMPSYGPEQRGGTANVTVIISDEQISSPILNEYDVAIVLNQPSMDKFMPMVKKGGIMLYDSNGVQSIPERDDVNVYRVDAVDESVKMANTKVFNMIVLGGLLKVAPMIDIHNVEAGLKKTLPERHHKLIPLNLEALQRGMEIIQHERVAK